MDRKTREELNQLSKEAFGASSKWQKLVNRGVPEPYERKREVVIPRANGELVTKTFTDHKYINKHYTVDEVRKVMTDILERKKLANDTLNAIKPSNE